MKMIRSRILKSTPYNNTTLSSVVIHALVTAKGITWLGNVRIPYKIGDRLRHNEPSGQCIYYDKSQYPFKNRNKIGGTDRGRFPANLLISDDVLNDGTTTKSRASDYNYEESKQDNPTHITRNIKSGIHYHDSGSYSRYFDLDKWWNILLERIENENSDL